MYSLRSSRVLLKSSPIVGRTTSRFGSISFVRSKYSLPELDYEFSATEPYISGKINEIHYTKHHQTYVNNLNASIEQAVEAKSKGEVKKLVALQKAINFNGGGYINHCLWWKNLAPVSQGGGQPPSAESHLGKQIAKQYGSIDKLIEITNGKLAGIQGSGWAFIVKNKANGDTIDVITTANQDTVTDPNLVPLIAIDAWEHAYYLQYQNVKADYFKALWNVINWKEAERRYQF
ncbi:SOD2 Superoxide dismutase [Mn] [Candida maltosa Xu316]|uniref:Superoxide dismutase n=1 Tax=Candida maltosa (strain Xu316) TaxID=1245528 RepID=M3IJS3_CANMX|nr:Superoxide dismutase [Mn], mitochondrial [Candida maltosa Xu316]